MSDACLKELLHRAPEVTELLLQLGRPEDGTDPTLPSNFEIFANLRSLDPWRRELAEMARNLRELAAA